MNIVIVGCSRGIGKFLLDNLHGRWTNIFCISRTHIDAFSFQADVTKPAELERAEKVLREGDTKYKGWNHVDALIYCAGSQGRIGPLVQMSSDEWADTIQVNLNGFFNTFRTFHPLLEKARGRPKVLAFSGGGATKSRPNFTAYAASKAGLVRLVETLADELPHFDINTIAPGSISTDMTREIIAAGDRAGEKELQETERAQKKPTEALELIRFLISHSGDGISGRLIAAKWDDWSKQGCYTGDVGKLRREEP